MGVGFESAALCIETPPKKNNNNPSDLCFSFVFGVSLCVVSILPVTKFDGGLTSGLADFYLLRICVKELQ